MPVVNSKGETRSAGRMNRKNFRKLILHCRRCLPDVLAMAAACVFILLATYQIKLPGLSMGEVDFVNAARGAPDNTMIHLRARIRAAFYHALSGRVKCMALLSRSSLLWRVASDYSPPCHSARRSDPSNSVSTDASKARGCLGNHRPVDNGRRSGDNVTTADNHVFIGSQAGNGITTADNNIVIGHLSGVHSVFGQVSDRCFIDNIFGAPVSAGTAAIVLVDSDGRLGTFTVDGPDPGRFSPLPAPRQAVPENEKQARLNLKVDKLQATVTQQQKQIKALTAQLKEQAAEIQKVSAQLEMSKPASKAVVNNL